MPLPATAQPTRRCILRPVDNRLKIGLLFVLLGFFCGGFWGYQVFLHDNYAQYVATDEEEHNAITQAFPYRDRVLEEAPFPRVFPFSQAVYGNFDIIADPFSRFSLFSPSAVPPHRTRAARCALLGAHADRMLCGA